MSTILIIIFIALIFSAFFSGMEIAFLSSNRLQIELEKKQNEANAPIISTNNGKASVRVIRTDEEWMIAKTVSQMLTLTKD